MKLTGKPHKFGANVDTDVIIPARYLNVSELAEHCMEPTDNEFALYSLAKRSAVQRELEWLKI